MSATDPQAPLGGRLFPVVNGEADGLLMTRPELLWLRACWMATADLVPRGRSRTAEHPRAR